MEGLATGLDEGTEAPPEMASLAHAPPQGPTCPYCERPARLSTGAETVPHRPAAATQRFWACTPCKAYVGCHDGTAVALGTPAKHLLRLARRDLHDLYIDPLWRTALETGGYDKRRPRFDIGPGVMRKARERVYGWLAERLGLDARSTHVALFDLETCRRAQDALRGVSYPEIQAWGRAKDKTERSRRRAAHRAAVLRLARETLPDWAWTEWLGDPRAGDLP